MKNKLFRIMAVLAMLIPIVFGLTGLGQKAEADSGQAQFTIHKMNFEGDVPGGPWENTGDRNDIWGGLNQGGTLDGAGVEFSAYDVTEKYYEYLALETGGTYKERRNTVIQKLQKEYENMVGDASEDGFIMTQANSSAGAFTFDNAAFKQKKTVDGEEKYAVYIFVETKSPDTTLGKQVPMVAILPILKNGTPLSFIDIYGKNVIPEDDNVGTKELTDPSTVDIVNSEYGNVKVGDILDYTITVPITSQTNQVKISDMPTGGLKYVDNSATSNANVSGDNLGGKLVLDGDGFTIDLSGAEISNLQGQDLVIHYKMEVTSDAEPDVEMTNDAKVGFNGNDPTVDLGTTEEPGEDPKNPPLFTGGKKFVKADSTDNTVLPDAKFYVTRGSGADEEILLVDAKDGYKWVKVSDLPTDTLKDQTSIEGYTDGEYTIKAVESGADGKFEIKGIQYGNYFLNEYVSPEGYSLLPDGLAFEVVKDGYNDPAGIDTVNNTPEGFLPDTGGNGIALFLLIGAVLMGGAAVWYKKSRNGAAEV